MCRGAFAALALLWLVPAVDAEIFKCVDAAGRTTYQQTRCPTTAKGGPIQIQSDNGRVGETPEEATRWDAVAREQNIEVGMPRRYVERVLGAPNEVRQSDMSDGAAEIWIYGIPPGATMRVGFVAANVVWFRREGAAPSDPASPTPP